MIRTDNRLRLSKEEQLSSTTENINHLTTVNSKNLNSNNKAATERSRSYSNGKLLLTGEYVVLDGALSLAIPTKYGQSLSIEPIEAPKLIWTSFDESGQVWFQDEFIIKQMVTSLTPKNDISDRLLQILNASKKLSPNFLNTDSGFKVTTTLDFPRHWGLGTSSTLLNNIAQWALIDAFQLLKQTFGGSGYDIACAQYNTPITYQLENSNPIIKQVVFNPPFIENLYFVHLNKKQNSRDGIKHYHDHKENSKSAIREINAITAQMTTCDTLNHFKTLMFQHETIISKLTKQTPVKNLLFNDFKGAIKSLGAWGGDFVLVASKENPTEYFKEKGFKTVVPYKEMAL
ncbi:GYDIA family GHMP kinase [Flaviramulus aquimarinus]|uniref:GYDIA family GHMP kinase n=1 Tax=Flaviramulus aquimarinus TaxID=1170456 RepID=A0ABP9EZZ2_9FLAO